LKDKTVKSFSSLFKKKRKTSITKGD